MTTKRQDLVDQDLVDEMVDEHELVEAQEARRERTPLLEILDRALDKGVHIDGWIRVPVLGLDVLDLEFDVLIASSAKYLEYAEAIEKTASVGGRDDDTDNTDTRDDSDERDGTDNTDSEDREGEPSLPHPAAHHTAAARIAWAASDAAEGGTRR